MKMKKILVILLLLGMFFIANVHETQAAIIDFGRTNISSPGVISYAGGTAPLVGTGVALQLVTNGPIEYDLVNATLDFTTGAYLGGNQFAPGGSITVTGGVEDIDEGTLLLTGSFTGTTTLSILGGTAKGIFPTFTDLKNDDLAALFGYAPSDYTNGWSGWFNLTFDASGIPPTGFRSTKIYSGDIVNNAAVPEPSSLMLLGMGILGLFGLGKRRS